jgi:hypothetical protein
VLAMDDGQRSRHVDLGAVMQQPLQLAAAAPAACEGAGRSRRTT